jgi:PAS domain S-box-containing protein
MHKARDETAARLAAIVESSDDAIISKDLNGYVTSWNAAAERMFGYPAAEMIGRHITTIIPADRRDEEEHVISEIRLGRRVEHFETVRCRKDGTLFDVSLSVSPIHAGDGDVIGASKIARDITEQKRLRRAAAEASRAKDEFLATLSHELRTPLNAVVGYTHLLQIGALEPAKALEAIVRNGEALTRLVNDVLDASRIVTGRMRLNLQQCDLAIVAREAIETITPATVAKSHCLRVALDDGLILNGDPDRLRQVVWNLLSNAVKFTPAGGTISVRGTTRGSSLLLEVVDTGSGITAAALPHVFELFWQADSTHTHGHNKLGGLGLGLSLVRHFIELHGGDVTVESEGVGKGARFRIELPRFAVYAEKKGGVEDPAWR